MLKLSLNSDSDSAPRYTAWNDFDVEEYVSRNYGKKLLDEDRLIILEVIKHLKAHNIKPDSWTKVADVGAGPNFYPAMLLAPFVRPSLAGGQIDLIEYSSANRAYVKSILSGNDRPQKLTGVWHKFEQLMEKEADVWSGAFHDARKKAKVIAGSIFELPQDYYDAVSAYFVPESITDDLATCEKAVHCLIGTVKKDGFIMVAHMLGSQGWPAGKGTLFPAVPLTVQDLEKMYAGKAAVKIMRPDAVPGARPGYHGMAIAVGHKI